MRYAYFPGCTLGASAQDYDMSFRWVCRSLGIDLEEVRDWVCCGAFSARATSRLLAVTMPAGNLARAEQEGFNQMIVPCAVGLARMRAAQHALETDRSLRKRVDEVLDKGYNGTVRVVHPLEVLLNEVGVETLGARVNKRLRGLKVACYYGCSLTRPPKVARFDNTEYPMSMDNVLRSVGLETLDWAYKTECCGINMTVTQTDIILHLAHRILKAAKAAGADVIAVCCPFCQANLDMRQGQIAEAYDERFDIPVLYFTQLMGIVFGAYSGELGLSRPMVSPQRALENYGIL
jgi:heterodisulfide reductase subunit B